MLLGFTYSRIIGGKVAVCALGTALTLPFHLKSPNTAIFPAVPPIYLYFGRQRKGKCSHRTADKVVVFRLLKQNGKIYTITNAQTATLLPTIYEQIKSDCIVYVDCYFSYDVLDVSEFSHSGINHSIYVAER